MDVHILLCGYVCFMAFGAGQDLGQQIALNDLAGVSQKWKLVAEKLNMPYSKATSGAVSACAGRWLYHTSEWLWHDVGQRAGVYTSTKRGHCDTVVHELYVIMTCVQRWHFSVRSARPWLRG